MPANATVLPPPTEPALPTAQERSLRELALMLGQDTGFKLALATFSDLQVRTNLLERLTGLLEPKGVILSQLEFTAGDPHASLLRRLQDHISKLQMSPGQRHAVSVIGLENLIALRHVTGGPFAEGTGFLEEANLHRDAFAKACPMPLVIWLTPADTTAFAQSATDLWHWRSATFDFSSDSGNQIGVIESLTGRNRSSETSKSPDQLRKRSQLLKRQLAELNASPFGNTLRALSQRANLLGELGEVFEDLADYTDAKQCLEERLRIAERINDEQHLASALRGLARLQVTIGEFDKAEYLMRRALTIDEKIFGTEHPNVAGDLNNLAALFYTTNRLAEAEPILRRTLAVEEKLWGTESANLVINLHNLAVLLKNTNRPSEAESLVRRALSISEKSFGPEHHQVAICLSNLAQLLHLANRQAEAEPLMRRALAIEESKFGAEHPNIAMPLNNLGALLQSSQRMTEAEPLVRRAVKILENSLGQYHPNVAIAINNLANLLKDTGRLTEAEILYRRALDIDQKNFGPEHPNYAIRLNNLAGLLINSKRLEEAKPLMEQSIAIFGKFKQSTGHENPNWKTAFANYKDLLQAMKLPPEEIVAKLHAVSA